MDIYIIMRSGGYKYIQGEIYWSDSWQEKSIFVFLDKEILYHIASTNQYIFLEPSINIFIFISINKNINMNEY